MTLLNGVTLKYLFPNKRQSLKILANGKHKQKNMMKNEYQKQPPEVLYVLKNFAKFTGKQLCQSLVFNKVACNFIKKRFWHGCFPVNFAKRLRAPFLQNTSGRLLLEYVRLHLHIHVGYTKQPQSISEILSVVCKLTYGRTDLLDFM